VDFAKENSSTLQTDRQTDGRKSDLNSWLSQ